MQWLAMKSSLERRPLLIVVVPTLGLSAGMGFCSALLLPSGRTILLAREDFGSRQLQSEGLTSL